MDNVRHVSANSNQGTHLVVLVWHTNVNGARDYSLDTTNNLTPGERSAVEEATSAIVGTTYSDGDVAYIVVHSLYRAGFSVSSSVISGHGQGSYGTKRCECCGTATNTRCSYCLDGYHAQDGLCHKSAVMAALGAK